MSINQFQYPVPIPSGNSDGSNLLYEEWDLRLPINNNLITASSPAHAHPSAPQRPISPPPRSRTRRGHRVRPHPYSQMRVPDYHERHERYPTVHAVGTATYTQISSSLPASMETSNEAPSQGNIFLGLLDQSLDTLWVGYQQTLEEMKAASGFHHFGTQSIEGGSPVTQLATDSSRCFTATESSPLGASLGSSTSSLPSSPTKPISKRAQKSTTHGSQNLLLTYSLAGRQPVDRREGVQQKFRLQRL
ncbi:hypothetical protein CVT24_013334 [Panaeolus cyanescens]|uniref:Uncharacterized protein n=1 Tax=Panaeolus cyanescens TaxID=181874 RepID=A0A409WAD0_9AGAR|nr:hypothetical protein CVT24_013334 [Panaeolus cyanescens]